MKPWILTVLAVVATWLYVVFGTPLALALVLMLGLCAWLVSLRRWRPLAVLAMTSPFGVAAIWAAASYSAGKGRLWTVGLPAVGLANVSPSSCLQTVSSGCMVSGGEWAIQLPNNAVLLVMTSLFGPMRGAYDGPYSNDAEVDEALRAAVPVSLAAVQADRVIVGSREVRLRPGLGRRLVQATTGSQGATRRPIRFP